MTKLSYAFEHNPSSDELYIFFSPSFLPEDKFFYQARAASLRVNKLFVKDPYNQFYYHSAEELLRLISLLKIELGIKKTVYWGSSAGAYAAILCGGQDPHGTVVAFAPHLHLMHAHSSADAALGNIRDSISPDLRDLRYLLNFGLASFRLFFPVYSGKDALHARDGMADFSSQVQVTFVKADHGIEYALENNGMSQADIFRLANDGDIPSHFIATATEIAEINDLCIMYHCEHEDALGGVDFDKVMNSTNPEVRYWGARQLWRKGHRVSALGLIACAADTQQCTHHYKLCLARYAAELDAAHLAVTTYQDLENTDFELEDSDWAKYFQAAIHIDDVVTVDRLSPIIRQRQVALQDVLTQVLRPDFDTARYAVYVKRVLDLAKTSDQLPAWPAGVAFSKSVRESDRMASSKFLQ